MTTVRPEQRAVLVGADSQRLLALAAELETRGLEVAVYSELPRALQACADEPPAVLVAAGPLPAAETPEERPVTVPLVLLAAPDAPPLPLRPLGPHLQVDPALAPSAVAERVLALLPPPASPGASPEPARGTAEALRLEGEREALARYRLLVRVLVALVGLALGVIVGLLFLHWAGTW
jgi:hypothetical protein